MIICISSRTPQSMRTTQKILPFLAFLLFHSNCVSCSSHSTKPLAVTLFDVLGLQTLRQAREQLFLFAGQTGENSVDFRTNLRNNVSWKHLLPRTII